MKNKLVPFLVAALVMFGCTAVNSMADADWSTDYTAALKQAKESGRPVLVDFTGSDWCGWCIKLDKEVFSQQAFKDYAKDNLVLLQLDFPRAKPQTDEVKKQNQELAGKFGIRGYPTIVLVDSEGKELARTGYQAGGAEKYVEHLKKLLEKK